MTQPNESANNATNNPDPHPQTHVTPPAPTPPRPVIVNAQPDNTQLHESVAAMGQTLAALPERIVDFFREATQAQQSATAPPAGTTDNPPAATVTTPPASTAHSDSTPKGSKLAQWWFKGGK